MKKITLVALLGLSSSLLGSDNALYFGIEGGNNKVEVASKDEVYVPSTNATGATNSTITESESGQTLKLGYYLSNNTRGYGFLQQAGDVDMYGIGYDYIFDGEKLKPFVGVVAGKVKLDDMDGIAYGGQVGVQYPLNDKFSLEAGYKYLKTNADTTVVSNGTYLGDPATLTETAEMETIKNIYIGVNYRF